MNIEEPFCPNSTDQQTEQRTDREKELLSRTYATKNPLAIVSLKPGSEWLSMALLLTYTTALATGASA